MARPGLGPSYVLFALDPDPMGLSESEFGLLFAVGAAGGRTGFAVSAVLNLTVLLGRLVVTNRARAEAEGAADRRAA